MSERLSFKLKARNFFKKFRKLFSKIDFPDILGLIALGMIFNGLYLWKPPVAWVVVGFLLLIISAFAAKK